MKTPELKIMKTEELIEDRIMKFKDKYSIITITYDSFSNDYYYLTIYSYYSNPDDFLSELEIEMKNFYGSHTENDGMLFKYEIKIKK